MNLLSGRNGRQPREPADCFQIQTIADPMHRSAQPTCVQRVLRAYRLVPVSRLARFVWSNGG
ncbi:hypothetical protein PSAC2689_280014 [Paraburkholderia sacchari]